MAYLVIGNSTLAISLLLMLIRRGEATRVSALFFGATRLLRIEPNSPRVRSVPTPVLNTRFAERAVAARSRMHKIDTADEVFRVDA